ncbi:undecaprenyl-diphosphatase UppP [Candidatus Kaiserbacteria bacterium RIFCSPLOWO2_02_FULL_45_11b]|uniref:Undecaprenyl-diphosphatase n=1 Tax=Candidatus Kaiserbacteria bacterium RIFCSPLOWO2_12_FULL_45_26 TaxID=1798525 RepID=A0A1F6FHC1_9BACT|nr:MAG: undecaprenyl-diphosphatase UppP [Candidatus Kaiserbacteria bacterium RIFCSPHIGHO2_12_45_16]OGG70098.1 MAG: undecaprenyl-diphosphatase UppP [Candidatus Kaiserbacteria bacterium RIFCSPLOWO2_01_FULL_45_25]OGG83774.1 MAG: undecaprenyl-diphosphatase UppP [Candidatus Kaiserbacteria bacterium RIFCSPLOWO2_02_FULL_45_11b]OGG85268.1 MAG: undecaprenyl-diphosphatase UppP [Candidatus Kaiserbacteria bacterium RIFCSPLOWO2_12_FULL_45_26]
MDITTALILGVLQGITEFVPISSSAHLLLVGDLLSLEGANSLAFYAVLHLATTAAIIMFFWTDVLALIQTAIRRLGRLPVNEKDQILLFALMVGTVPAVVVGLLFEEIITTVFHTPIIIAAMLFVSSFFFMFAEWRYYIKPPQGALTIRQGFWVGCFQALALLPGFSRSGSTLAGGMLLGMTRVEAARFSFILAIPITLAVGLKMLLELILSAGEVSWGVIAIGAFICFITALVVIRFFLDFIRKYSLWPFIWYKIGLALLVAYVTIYV